MRRLLLSLAVLAFFINPGIACSSSDEGGFEYGEADMRAAVEGQWQLAWSAPGRASVSATVQISEASGQADRGVAATRSTGQRGRFIRAAAACCSRTFVKSAAACVDMSRMDLQVAYVSGESALQNATLAGSFMVGSLTFRSGYMQLVLDQTHLTVIVRPDGTVESSQGTSPDGQLTVTATRVSL